MVTVLGENHHVKTTTIQDGYNIKEEQDKFLWADVVIYQTPIYWFSVPGLFKTYMDEVYESFFNFLIIHIVISYHG